MIIHTKYNNACLHVNDSTANGYIVDLALRVGGRRVGPGGRVIREELGDVRGPVRLRPLGTARLPVP